ncbi:aspartyl-phosphate phosphatase Spo0E family protein [Marinicrinis sediminis]|uniref:Aspartyl-phosphate phosphatase Spo0E family protein n=1 Tax=Marinicrinis sediminis TaxID=1652465 RepID=A0ABW5RF32_9BACL
MKDRMMMEAIERLRQEMVETAMDRGSMLHEEVIQLSHQLDRLLVYYQKMKTGAVVASRQDHSLAAG